MTGEIIGWIIIFAWLVFLTFRCISLEHQRDQWKKRTNFWRQAYEVSEKLREKN